MYYLFVIIIILFSIQSGVGQGVFPMAQGFDSEVRDIHVDTTSNEVYAVGSFTFTMQSGLQVNGISKWNGVQWDSLGSGINDGGIALKILDYNGYKLVGGSFNLIGGVQSKGIALWNLNSWQFFANATQQGFGCVTELFVDNGNLYIGGCFDTINNIAAEGIAKFDGQNWITYPPIGSANYYVNAIIVYNNELYIGGNFAGGPGKNGLMKYNGSTWVSVGGGLSTNSWVNDFAIYNNELYVAGYFNVANGDPGNNIAIWDGLNWSQPANGLFPSNVFCMHVFEEKLYAGGQISNASGIPVSFVAIWDSLNWSSFGNHVLDNSVLTLSSQSQSLYIGGGFQFINGIQMNGIARYDTLTGINENSFMSNELFFSNANNYLYFNSSLSNFNIEIVDLLGKIVYNKYFETNSNFINLNDLVNGVYIVTIIGEVKSKQIKILKF